MSSPFQKSFSAKSPMSPLNGAYTSAADGIVPVSYADIHKDFQKGVADNVAKAYAPKNTSCDNLVQKLSDNKISNAAYETLSKKCAKKDPDEETPPVVKSKKPKSNKNTPPPNAGQRAAQYGETPPSESTSVIPESNSIFSGGMVHQNTPCPPGQSRDPITGMCG